MSNGNYREIIGLCLGFSGNPTVRNILFSTVYSYVIWSSEFLKYTQIHICFDFALAMDSGTETIFSNLHSGSHVICAA